MYSSVSLAARGLFRALGLRIDVQGDEHVPRDGAFILVSNHVSYLDFLLVRLAARRSRRRVRFLARHDLWGNPVVGGLLSSMGHVPVDRAAPAGAFLQARSLLRQGEAVGVFPEAGVSTSYTVRALMPGTVALAHATGVPVLPMAIWGPQRILTAHRPVDPTRGRPVSLLVGPPMTFRSDGTGAVRSQTVTLGLRLQSLLDELQGREGHRPRVGEHAPWHPAHLGGTAPGSAAARLAETVPTSAVPLDSRHVRSA